MRINTEGQRRTVGSSPDKVKEAAPGRGRLPVGPDRLPAVPQQARAEVDRNLALLDKQLKDASDRVATRREPR